jgi:hypothetical protein
MKIYLYILLNILGLIYSNDLFIKRYLKYKYSKNTRNAFNKINKILQQNIKSIIILEGNNNILKKNMCETLSYLNYVNFYEYSFDSFILSKPYLKNKNSIIYINNFLLSEHKGRILNEDEYTILKNLPKSTNLIIFNANNIKKMKYIDNIINIFPIISLIKLNININHINKAIKKYKYDNKLLNINWTEYNIELLSFEKINILLYEINKIINELNIDNIEYYIKNILFYL